jgi:hypothetical protein
LTLGITEKMRLKKEIFEKIIKEKEKRAEPEPALPNHGGGSLPGAEDKGFTKLFCDVCKSSL